MALRRKAKTGRDYVAPMKRGKKKKKIVEIVKVGGFCSACCPSSRGPVDDSLQKRRARERDGFLELFAGLGIHRESKSLLNDDEEFREESRFLPNDGEQFQVEGGDGASRGPDEPRRYQPSRQGGQMWRSPSGSLWVRPATLPRRRSSPDDSSRHGTPFTRCSPRRPNGYTEGGSSTKPSMVRQIVCLGNGTSYGVPPEKGYKEKLFNSLEGENKKVLELGIGTGPNIGYYANVPNVTVYGVDPNKQMEKYAKAAALRAGLPPSNFYFTQAAGEGLPAEDCSMDFVVGTLVLCSVKDVRATLEEVLRVLKPGGRFIFLEHVAALDGTPLRLLQGILNPLQKFFADGCHLNRETGKEISKAGFSDVDLNMSFVPGLALLSPHVYGVAIK
ncbi:uncharacterized protein LOC116247368 isoform X1 [Nymphaea colorata]|nr:uncharacterized protein LOC116247368 isoform X1 [Nymphaea colorata]